jgi:hypothetical protein
MFRSAFRVIGVVAVTLLTACGGASTDANNVNTPTAQTSTSPSAAASAAATSVDPCQVVTQSEASQLAGASFGAGKEDSTAGGSKVCWYGAQTTNVFEVLVAQASSAAAAQAQWDSYKSQVQTALQEATSSSGVTVSFNQSDTSIAGADRAAVGTFSSSGSGYRLAGTAAYLLKGSTFLAIVDLVLNQTPPTTQAMEAQAKISLQRLP